MRQKEDFYTLPDEAMTDIQGIAAVTNRAISTTWRVAATDPNFPKAIHLSTRCTRYKVGDVRRWLEGLASAAPAPRRVMNPWGPKGKPKSDPAPVVLEPENAPGKASAKPAKAATLKAAPRGSATASSAP